MIRNYLVATISVILVVVGGFLLVQNLKNKTLPTGTMSQPTPSLYPTTVPQTPLTGRPQVTITTSKGDIVIEMRPDLAPKTVANFLDKFTHGYCNNLTWHRVEDWVVQGCDPKGDGTGGNTTLLTETSSQPFTIGAVGVARKASPKEVSNDSQFFVVKKDSTFLNGEYTYFGQVVSGMDVVNKLEIGDRIISSTIMSK